MFLKNPKLLFRSTSFRLISTAMLLFLLGALAINFYSYYLVSKYIYDQSRDEIEEEISDLSKLYQKEGLEAVREDAFEEEDDRFLVRIISSDNSILLDRKPKGWPSSEDDTERSAAAENLEEWRYLTADQSIRAEVVSKRLSDGKTIQLGQVVENREELLKRIREVYFLAVLPFVLIGYLVAIFVADRALSPIHKLISVMSSIVTDGRIDQKVTIGDSRGDRVSEELVLLFNSMLEKINSLIKGIKEVLDNVAHDLRTPMTRLRNSAENALAIDSDPKNLTEALSDCVEESERVLIILNTLMDVSEAETGTLRLELKSVSLASLFTEIIDLYCDVAADKRIAVTSECPVDLTVIADPNWLRQVLANLLDNSLKYTPEGGSVRVYAWKGPSQVNICVQDTGIGVPQEELSKIWERLYRGDKTRTTRGLGLGLSLVKAIVNAHRGTVSIQSEFGSGSTFSISIPAE